MKKFLFAALAVAALSLTGCVKSPVSGFAYTDIKDGMAVTGNAGSSKVGTAEVKGYVGLVALGDASIQTAAREAGITRNPPRRLPDEVLRGALYHLYDHRLR